MKRAVYSFLGGTYALRAITFFRKLLPKHPAHEKYSEPLFGDWHGNDTVWRMTLDLNLVLFNATLQGVDFGRIARSYFGVIDGIIGMDHEAPLEGLPVESNLLIVGRDPVSVDAIGTYLMGFDPSKIRTISNAKAEWFPCGGEADVGKLHCTGNVPLEDARCKFTPTKGWIDFLAG